MISKDTVPHSNQPARYLLLIIFVGIVSRLIPHPPNMTPLISLAIMTHLRLNRWYAVGAMLIILLVSDSLLSLIFQYPALSHWSYFTYSGFLFTSFLFSYQKNTRFHYLLGSALVGTLIFWIWTNFGVWLTSGLYDKTATGLGICYFMALPFLRNAIIGSIIWMFVYYFALHAFFKKPLREITR
jgi:hypothetical protein